MELFTSIEKKMEELKTQLQLNTELKKELSRLEKANQEEAKKESIVMPQKKVVIEETEEEIKEDVIGDEAEFYFTAIKKVVLTGDLEEDLDTLREFMPSKESGYYRKIYLRIIANLNNEIREYRGEIERLKSECTEEELVEYFDELNTLKAKIKYLETLDKEKEIPIEQRKKNTIVFMSKSSDKYYALEDLLSIPIDFYDAFKELFDSIVDGTFKNVRYFKSINNRLAGVAEVKGFKVRVIFDRVSSHTYAVIACFLKKTDKNKEYLEFIANRIGTYRVKAPAMIESLNDSEYMESNKEVLEAINKLLVTKEVPSLNGRGIKQ